MKGKKILSIIMLLVLIATNITTSYAKVLTENETVNLVKDHTCVSLLKEKGADVMKTVVYVCYIDPNTNKKYPAFCVEPDKNRSWYGSRRFV